MSTEKSVGFDKGPPVIGVSLDVKTVGFDPDPMFHRSINSPVVPEPNVVVEQVGAFRIANLRNDSMGNLPRIISSEDAAIGRVRE